MISPPEVMLDRAIKRVGLEDMGPDGWQDGYERMVSAIGAAIPDDDEATGRLEDIIVARLVRRLGIEGWYGEHGDEALVPVEGPLVIMGLPRTGTTALNYLLANDPRFRYTRNWELDTPVPPPDLQTEHQDPRRAGAEREPNTRHIYTVDGPAEDGRIHELSFRNAESILPIPAFTNWWRSADHAASFAYHERVLRLLQSHRPPNRWLLKNPGYIFQIDMVLAQYPSARFIMTHRDPAAVLPSTCSTMLSSRQRRLPNWHTDHERFGQMVVDHFLEGVTRARASRQHLDSALFLDIGQRETQSDPIGVAERVYEFAGLGLDGELRRSMHQWAANNERGSRGEHRYRAEDFGLTADGIRRDFAGYLDEFGDCC
jgi:Sulfotransferase family